MAITDRAYRTCTYIAGDWTGDFSAIEELHKWNESEHWGLSFTDVHSLTQSRDSSQNCSIKSSLRTRMNYCKTFVLIVGEQTNSVTSGACFWCKDYITSSIFLALHVRRVIGLITVAILKQNVIWLFLIIKKKR